MSRPVLAYKVIKGGRGACKQALRDPERVKYWKSVYTNNNSNLEAEYEVIDA